MKMSAICFKNKVKWTTLFVPSEWHLSNAYTIIFALKTTTIQPQETMAIVKRVYCKGKSKTKSKKTLFKVGQSETI